MTTTEDSPIATHEATRTAPATPTAPSHRVPAEPAATDAQRSYPVLRWLVAATFTVILNETIMVNAIPRLMAQFEVTARAAQWLSTAFMLTMAVVIPVTAWGGDPPRADSLRPERKTPPTMRPMPSLTSDPRYRGCLSRARYPHPHTSASRPRTTTQCRPPPPGGCSPIVPGGDPR